MQLKATVSLFCHTQPDCNKTCYTKELIAQGVITPCLSVAALRLKMCVTRPFHAGASFKCDRHEAFFSCVGSFLAQLLPIMKLTWQQTTQTERKMIVQWKCWDSATKIKKKQRPWNLQSHMVKDALGDITVREGPADDSKRKFSIGQTVSSQFCLHSLRRLWKHS